MVALVLVLRVVPAAGSYDATLRLHCNDTNDHVFALTTSYRFFARLTSIYFKIYDLFDFSAQFVLRAAFRPQGAALAVAIRLQICLVFLDVVVATPFVVDAVAFETFDSVT